MIYLTQPQYSIDALHSMSTQYSSNSPNLHRTMINLTQSRRITTLNPTSISLNHTASQNCTPPLSHSITIFNRCIALSMTTQYFSNSPKLHRTMINLTQSHHVTTLCPISISFNHNIQSMHYAQSHHNTDLTHSITTHNWSVSLNCNTYWFGSLNQNTTLMHHTHHHTILIYPTQSHHLTVYSTYIFHSTAPHNNNPLQIWSR